MMGLFIWGSIVRVSANKKSGYVFNVEPKDIKYMTNGFKGYLTQCDGGVTYNAAALLPDFLVMGNPYLVGAFPLIALRTYAPRNQFSALFDHAMTIDAEFNNVITLAQAAIPKVYNTITGDGGVVVANHIPQLFSSVIGGGLIVGVDGVYDWQKKHFFGQIYTGGLL